MELNLFENKNNKNSFIKQFINEIKAKNNREEEMKEKQNENLVKDYEEAKNTEDLTTGYDLYEKKKIFLDNKTRTGNPLAWIMDKNSVCISENGDGGPISIEEINLPKEYKIGQVYEKADMKYIFNDEITKELNKITK